MPFLALCLYYFRLETYTVSLLPSLTKKRNPCASISPFVVNNSIASKKVSSVRRYNKYYSMMIGKSLNLLHVTKEMGMLLFLIIGYSFESKPIDVEWSSSKSATRPNTRVYFRMRVSPVLNLIFLTQIGR